MAPLQWEKEHLTPVGALDPCEEAGVVPTLTSSFPFRLLLMSDTPAGSPTSSTATTSSGTARDAGW